MKSELIEILRCPVSGQKLQWKGTAAATENAELLEEWLVSEDGQHRYPVRGGIPRFVPESNYADNFGMQWNHFAKTQLDSHSGHSISADRFWMATGWNPAEMEGKWVLDVGCGSGRFAEVALSSGAQVVAMDYSSAVDACYANLRNHPNLHVIQGDIYAMPFAPETFSFVYSLGVLQHTPDVAKAFAALPPLVRGGGRLCVDYYEKSFKSRLLPKYWLRPFTKGMPKQKLFSLLETIVPILLPVSRTLGRIPVLGKLLKRTIPVANYDGLLPLTDKQLREWALLDTFDWLSPAYDNPQTNGSARTYMEQAKMEQIEVLKAGHLVARGRKPLQ
jgi:2-polyprenyl-3-methyl-5-hydroxy-6-metoxy-1,4-benzoquinol methylase